MYELDRPTRAGQRALLRVPDDVRYAPIGGDAMLPTQFEVIVWPDDTSRAVHRATFAVIDGRPVCIGAGAHMWSPEDREVQTADLRSIRVSDMLDHAVEFLGAKTSTPEPFGWGIGPDPQRTAHKAVQQGRRRLSPEHLREVATVYQEHIDGAPVAEVEARYGISRRTASLWVKKAREAGFITEMARKRDA